MTPRKQAGTNDKGEQFTFAQEYDWLGFTARKCILDLLQKVVDDNTLSLDVFAYDLGEPDVMKLLIQPGADNRARIILDNAALHHNAGNTKREDQFQLAFVEQAGAARDQARQVRPLRPRQGVHRVGCTGPKTVLTGSTNFSVTGLYVNSNHVMVFDDRDVADTYAEVFQEAWNDDVHPIVFADSQWAQRPFEFGGPDRIDTADHPSRSRRTRHQSRNKSSTGPTNRVEKEGQQNPTPSAACYSP